MSELLNNSGQGKGTPVPDIVAKKFNWGACFLNFIWGLGNNTPNIIFILIAVLPLMFIPVVGILAFLGLSIWFGVKGNEWAWQNKRFESIEAFHSYQKKWIIGWLIVFCSSIILGILLVSGIACYSLFTNASVQQDEIRSKAIEKVIDISESNEYTGNMCKLTSNELAKCYAKKLNVVNEENNKLTLADESVWIFNGDGNCKTSGDCSIDVLYKEQTLITIPLKLNENKYIEPDLDMIEQD